MTAAAPAPRLLLVLAHGIGPRELGLLRDGTTWSGALPTASLRLPPQPLAHVVDELAAGRELADLGVTVDRSALVLRPAGRSDAIAAEQLTRRPIGPADVTQFEARDVLAQAMIGGAVPAAAAARQLGALLDRLAAQLRRGDLPEVWFVGLGSPVPVERTFDLAATWRQRVLAPLAFELSLHVSPGVATIRGSNQRALDLAARALATRPFAPDGVLAPGPTGTLRFVAAPGIAFGRERLAARAPLPHEANGVACAPLGDLLRAADLDLAQVMLRFWLRAAALHVEPEDAVEPALQAAPQARADLLDSLAAPGAAVPSTSAELPKTPTAR